MCEIQGQCWGHSKCSINAYNHHAQLFREPQMSVAEMTFQNWKDEFSTAPPSSHVTHSMFQILCDLLSNGTHLGSISIDHGFISASKLRALLPEATWRNVSAR